MCGNNIGINVFAANPWFHVKRCQDKAKDWAFRDQGAPSEQFAKRQQPLVIDPMAESNAKLVEIIRALETERPQT
jgi:hypothetical protein